MSQPAASSQRVRVHLRLRPPYNSPIPSSVLQVNASTSTCLYTPPLLTSSGANLQPGSNSSLPTTFALDSILPSDALNGSVFTSTLLPLLKRSFKGYNSTLLCYGQTGSGKTYTCFGPSALVESNESRLSSTYESRGLIARALSAVFEEKNKRSDKNTNGTDALNVRISCLEIYNEFVYDLIGFKAGEAQDDDDSKAKGVDPAAICCCSA